jgi:hypothetical protein
MQPERPDQPEIHYLPKYPYLLFTLGVIGWIIAVIEAMVAGPIIAYLYLRNKGTKEPLKLDED